MKNLLIAVAILFVVGLVGYVSLSWSYQNKEIQLRNKIESVIDGNKSNFSKMQNIIFGNAEVAEKYSKDFTNIYPDLIKGRYSKHQGKIMQWVQESNPNYDTTLLQNVQKQITAQRESFHYAQLQLINLGKQHDDLLQEIPYGQWFLRDKQPIDIPVIKNEGVDTIFQNEIEQPKKLF